MTTAARGAARTRRHARVREKISGTAERPRLAIFRSITQIYAQLIDDQSGRTLAAASSLDAKGATGTKAERAKAAGTLLAERAKAAKLEGAVFDRGGYRYHGRVKALADAARAGGLKF
ncbi:MAG: 50S ribosomal protein L18 [Chloroflexi bacterium]|nr:50S ribosomal protein L18 [Chloroflexota bacterium]